MPRFYITTAIDYVNSRPHLGTAYEKVTADVIARYHRLAGDDTRFLMGNDEHSQNVYRKARELGLEPLAYCDRMEREFRAVWARLDISFDDFVRTSEPRHQAGVTRMVERIGEAGDLYEGFYEGFYCIGCEAFKPEKDLADGLCPVHQTRPDWIREKNHFFRLSRYRDRLLEHVRANPGFIEPEIRRNEILRLLESGLEDISISRAGQQWGIPLPADPDSVVYVWFDALINYISAVGYGTDDELFAQWWPADLHVIGKDITRFHCVVWPAMLMSAGLELPRRVFGHGFISLKGQKMSKSLGTVLDPLDAAARFGPDPLRLFLVREIPYGQDGDFSWERFEERYNSDLANNLGNLVNRLAAMAAKYRSGRLAAVGESGGRLQEAAEEALRLYRPAMERLALHEGAAAAFRLIDAANEFIAETEPWALAKRPEARDRLTAVLQDVAEALRLVAVMLLPVMPGSAAEILRRVGEARPVSELRLERDGRWQGGRERVIGAADPLWPRIEAVASEVAATEGTSGSKGTRGTNVASATKEQTMSKDLFEGIPPAPGAPAEPTPAAPATRPTGPWVTEGAVVPPVHVAVPSREEPRISIEEFMKVDLRVARVVAAERVPKAQKLVKMLIDLGAEERTIVAGIAEAYQPEALVGKSIVVVANLKPARVRGIESNGMLLAASPDGGLPTIVTFEQAPPPGTRVR
ncbi:MAG: methionine--tRNA ligase [Vicinamibacterales bacterium]